MDVSVSDSSNETWLLPFTPGELARALAAMAGGMAPAPGGAKPAALELSLLDDPEMARLNGSFLGLAGPTNVLAFPAGGAPTGSLALAVQTILRESRLYGQEPGRYTLKMLAHGLAHIMGYAHGPQMDMQAERAAEAALLLLNSGSTK